MYAKYVSMGVDLVEFNVNWNYQRECVVVQFAMFSERVETHSLILEIKNTPRDVTHIEFEVMSHLVI